MTRLDLAKSAFEQAYAITATIAAEGREWDPEYTLKEIRSVLLELIEKTEPENLQRQYELGLRIHALAAFYLGRLLEAAEKED